MSFGTIAINLTMARIESSWGWAPSDYSLSWTKSLQ